MRNGFDEPPIVPLSCRLCPINRKTVCQAFEETEFEAVQRFKIGDRVLPAGRHLYRPGETCSELYNVLDGWVALYQIIRNGRRQILDFALPGSFLGYQPDLSAALLHGAECITDVSVCVFPRSPFPDFVKENPRLGDRLAVMAARDTIMVHDHLTNVGCRSAQARIAYLLLTLCMRVKRNAKAHAAPEVVIPLTQNYIADALGMTSVYVSHTLRQLRENNLLTFKGGKLQVLDPDGLADIGDFDHLLLV